MKRKGLLLLCFIGLLNTAFAQYSTKSTNLKIIGDSNIHKWEMKANKSVFSGQIETNNGVITNIPSANFKVAIIDLKSDKDIMDARAAKSLNADKHPYIIYELNNTKSIQAKGADFVAVVEGKLIINGTPKATTLTVTLTPQTNGDIRVKTQDTISFTNHGLKAPSFVAGTMKVDNEVKVSIDLTLKK